MSAQTASRVPQWLAELSREEGYACISRPRRFAHEEADYDAQYANDPANMQVGRGLVALLRQTGADFSAPALEVGCGTGLVSLGLAAASPYPLTIITDPSPVFLRITENKVRKAAIDQERLAFAVLQGEEIDRVPAGSLSLVVLRSTLHHILDVDAFIAHAAATLRSGGILTFEEPCLEGYLLMGAVVQFLPISARAAGAPLTAEQEQTVDLFVRTMSFYSRRDLDKTTAEDKHLFRVDEIMKAGERSGLSVEFKANRTYETFENAGADERPRPLSFLQFTRNYLRYCMSWPQPLLAAFDEHLTRHCRTVDDASAGSWGPYLHGVFICRKR